MWSVSAYYFYRMMSVRSSGSVLGFPAVLFGVFFLFFVWFVVAVLPYSVFIWYAVFVVLGISVVLFLVSFSNVGPLCSVEHLPFFGVFL